MARKITGKYYCKNTSSGSYSDVTTLFDGVNVLSVDGFDSRGRTVNVYSQQWLDTQDEDFLITTVDGNNNPVIVRENVDVTVTFAVSRRYANNVIDEQTVYDNFVNYLTGSDVWIASKYVGKQVHCVALEGVTPQTVKLKRGNNSYILGEVKLHTLSKPTSYS